MSASGVVETAGKNVVASPTGKQSYSRLSRRPSDLDPIFHPRNVAVIGATENVGAVGRTILRNLLSSPFGGPVFPVNPKRSSVLGVKAYPTIGAVPEQVDLAVIVTPAPTVPGLIDDCVKAGVKSAIIISAGFKEIGPEGVELERRVMESARRGKMRIIGPNCLGMMNPVSGVNASFAKTMARQGNVAFISQSGALMTAVLDWSFKAQVGFSNFVSIGSMLDVDWGDLINYLGSDPNTSSIVIYMESIGDARSFLSAAREVALTKPIIVIKAGRTAAAAQAAASHTGSMTGSDEVLDAAFRRVGVLRVNTIGEMFAMAEVLAKQPRPKGNRLTIITNAGGPGVLATDSLITGGGELAAINKETVDQLSTFLPAAWSHANPIDVLGDAPAERYAKSLELAAKDPHSDGMLVILTPQDMTDPTAIANALAKHAKIEGKPVLASWMGGPVVEEGTVILDKAGIPTFDYPDTAARAFNYMWRYSRNLRSLYETPTFAGDGSGEPDVKAAEAIIANVRKSGRTILTEFESKQLLAAYGIPTGATALAATADEAAAAATKIGYPVVVKLHSETITHKTDVGGVKLNLANADAVKQAFNEIKTSVGQKAKASDFLGVTVQPMIKLRDAYEIIIGSSVDPQFGPVLLFGSGGQLVEVYKDRSLALPPLNATLARRMMEQTKIYTALKGVRGRKPVDLANLEDLLVRFSRLVVEQPWVKEIDINPLLASPDGLIALDGRVVLHEPATPEAKLPHAAIRPYPLQLVHDHKAKDGTGLLIRPIRPEDEPLLVKFHESLSEETVRNRYFAAINLDQRTSHERLTRVCFNDYDREIALVAQYGNNGDKQVVAVGRLSKLHGGEVAELAVIVSDNFQKRGIGRHLAECLVKVARQEGITKVTAEILPDNQVMKRIVTNLGFTITSKPVDPTIKAELTLS